MRQANETGWAVIPGDVAVDVDGDLVEQDLQPLRQLVALLAHRDRVVKQHLEILQ